MTRAWSLSLPAVSFKGPYRRYVVHYVVHQRDIDCPSAPGDRNLCTVHFIASVYDTDGLLIVTHANELKTMVRGAPEPTEIRFEAGVRPATADTQPALAPGNQGNPKNVERASIRD